APAARRMKRSLQRQVWTRAKSCCEYCQMPQAHDAIPFELDHVIALSHAGPTRADNLALACFLQERQSGLAHAAEGVTSSLGLIFGHAVKHCPGRCGDDTRLATTLRACAPALPRKVPWVACAAPGPDFHDPRRE